MYQVVFYVYHRSYYLWSPVITDTISSIAAAGTILRTLPYWSNPSVPIYPTGTIVGNGHYSTDTTYTGTGTTILLVLTLHAPPRRVMRPYVSFFRSLCVRP